ncbi:hypothetical protein TNCV_681851 [Trichonephila clavipes]|nr:hypothetical protein TNCV_681851 [Trichonephila clavipes]
MADKDIVEFVHSARKNIIDADFEEKNEMNNAVPVSSSSEMRNIMKSISSYLDTHSKGEMNGKMGAINTLNTCYVVLQHPVEIERGDSEEAARTFRSGVLLLDDSATATQNHIEALVVGSACPIRHTVLISHQVHLAPALKKNLVGRRFGSNAEVKLFFHMQSQEFFLEGFLKLIKRSDGKPKLYGMEAGLIKTIMAKIGVDYEIITPEEGQYGIKLSSENWTGI